jgi:hypothetical protein
MMLPRIRLDVVSTHGRTGTQSGGDLPTDESLPASVKFS